MNLLIDALPETVEIGGEAVALSTDFRTGIRFELLMQDSDHSVAEKIAEALHLYYPTLPADLQGAMEGMLWFYRCGEDAPEGSRAEGKGQVAKSYCFQQDASLILAAFRAEYGIDLATIPFLHWFTFRALFSALPSDCELKTVMGYRVADTKGMSKTEKKHFERMKKQYALKSRGGLAEVLSLAERNRRMKEYVARRFGEAATEKSAEISE